LEKEKITEQQKEETIRRVTFTSNINDCVADLIIEAVVEKKEIKQQLFDTLFLINNDETIFATNTSSISVSELSRDKKYAEHFAGMHFFNPAQLMKLVEIIRAEKTSDKIIETLITLAKQIGKTPVVCNDSPGFIVNRVARPFYIESLRLVEEGVIDLAKIDSLMESTGFKMGPFKLMDLIGNDINYAVSCSVYEQLGDPERLKPSFIQKEKVEKGELGKKTGKGYYEY